MSSWRPDEDVLITDSEDEENESLRREYYGREAMLFVVDASLCENQDRFTEALEIIKSAFISGMLVNDKELMGVVFANTEMSPDPYEPRCLDHISVPANCAVFLPLRQLTKPIVEHFLSFQASAIEEFPKNFGVAENGGNFSAMIRLCLNLFEHCTYKLAQSKIVYLTDRTTPHQSQTHEYQIALQKANDLEGKMVEFYVIPMIDDFDYEPFYKEFLTLVKDVELDSFVAPDAKQQREILTERKLKQDFQKRCLGHFNMSLGPNLELSAQYYSYYKRRSYPRKVTMLRKDNTALERKYMMMVRKQDPETAEFVSEHQVKATGGWYEINLGNMPIRITPDRMNRVRDLHKPGMMLLGFKPILELPSNWYYKSCNFMYPDDQKVVGSKRLFRALWERCLDRKKMAICLFMRKRKSIPRYVALIPVSLEKSDIKSHLSLLGGDGFKIVYLPFAKHIRDIDFTEWNCIDNASTTEGIEIFQKVIKKLKINYEPEVISDPVLENIQSKLLAMAFDIRTDGIDETANAKMQDERIAQLLPDIKRLFGEDTETTVATKRRANCDGASGNAPKMAKVTEQELKSLDYVKSLLNNNSLISCTAAQLRMILEMHFGVKTPKASNKQALVDRIYELFV